MLEFGLPFPSLEMENLERSRSGAPFSMVHDLELVGFYSKKLEYTREILTWNPKLEDKKVIFLGDFG